MYFATKSIEMIHIYSDGACHGNGQESNIGGCGYIVVIKGEKFIHYTEVVKDTTNNRMELLAAIKSLEFLLKYCNSIPSIIYTDSQYVQKGAEIWSVKWIKKGWKDVKNQDLWRKLIDLKQKTQTKIEWVRGHNGNKWNEEIDRLIQEDIKFG
jgi:ribonuclease HI